jgi:hypothetical protein
MQEDWEGSDWQRKYFMALMLALFPTLKPVSPNINNVKIFGLFPQINPVGVNIFRA